MLLAKFSFDLSGYNAIYSQQKLCPFVSGLNLILNQWLMIHFPCPQQMLEY